MEWLSAGNMILILSLLVGNMMLANVLTVRMDKIEKRLNKIDGAGEQDPAGVEVE